MVGMAPDLMVVLMVGTALGDNSCCLIDLVLAFFDFLTFWCCLVPGDNNSCSNFVIVEIFDFWAIDEEELVMVSFLFTS